VMSQRPVATPLSDVTAPCRTPVATPLSDVTAPCRTPVATPLSDVTAAIRLVLEPLCVSRLLREHKVEAES